MTTSLTQRVDQFSTELLVRQLGGPLLLDQTFAVPFSDPLVQSALLSARQLLAGQGATGFTGPALLANMTTLTSSKVVSSFLETAPALKLYNTTSALGGFDLNHLLVTAQAGNIGQCQGVTNLGFSLNAGVNVLQGVPFGCDANTGNVLTVAFGTQNLNVNEHTLYSLGVTNTTTNSFLTTQSYELDGTRGPASIPEPGTFASMAVVFAGLWGLLIRRRKALDAP